MDKKKLLEAAETDAAMGHGELLEEHLELAHYIDLFKSSAEYVRRIILVMLLFSVVMLVAQWNTTSGSWVPRRYRKLAEVYSGVKDKPDDKADADVRKWSGGRLGSREELREYLHEYQRARVERVMLVDIPGVGVTFDINDLGNFCGLAYFIILTTLVLALIREHENLYLALFKVRRLHDRDKNKSDGESKGNYLYHALAMSQVLSSPPTLAQWKQPKFKRALLNFVLFVPAIVQAYVIWANSATLAIVKMYDVSPAVMIPQYALLLVNLSLGILALLYTEACNHRWKSAFLYVNPALKHIEAQPWPLWVKRPTSLPKEPLQRRLWAQAIGGLRLAHQPKSTTITVEHALALESARISYREVVRLCGEMEAMAAQKAHAECAAAHLINGRVTSSVLNGAVWEVTAEFDVHC